MITKITGQLTEVHDDQCALAINSLEYEVLLPNLVAQSLAARKGEEVTLHTLEYLEGNVNQGQLTPRLVGFRTTAEREFFELFCKVDGIGPRKALRALVRPIQEVATAIVEQNVAALSGLPGIGESTGERVVAKLRKKVTKFALMTGEGEPQPVTGPGFREEAFEALKALGHAPTEANRLIEMALRARPRVRSAAQLIEEIYRQMAAGGGE